VRARDHRGVLTPVCRVWPLFALVVLLAACKADVRVDIALRDDGSGTVRVEVALDADAVRRLTQFAPLEDAVPLDDIKAAGWDVSAWESSRDRGATVTLSHGFVGRQQLDQLLGDLGPDGVSARSRVERSRGWLRSRDALAVDVDLRQLAAGVKSDASLATNLQAAGIDVNALDAQLTEQLRQSLTVELVVHAPDGTTRRTTVRPGETGKASVGASTFDSERVVAVGVAGALVLVAALLLVAARRSKRRAVRRARR
jgi:hypothetical protein